MARLLPTATRSALGATLAALALVAAAAGPAADGARADVAQVTVVSPGGAQRTLSLDALAGSEDVVDGVYALRGPAGKSSQTVTGFSPAALLEAAGVDPFGFSYVEVQRPAGGSVLLSRHQALDPGAFADGPPVVYATAAGTGFLRPSAGEDDANAGDSFEAPQGVTLVLRKGSPLRVRAVASTVRTRPGKSVAFSAIVERAGTGEQLAYSWYFDDGSSAEGAEVRHSFAARGSYDVVVGVTTPGDDTGASAVVTVQVGPPLGGPDRKGGGTDESASAPDHGAAVGSDTAPAPGGSAPASGAGNRGDGEPAQSPHPARSHLCPDSESRCDRKRGATGRRVTGILVSSTAPSASQHPTRAARAGNLTADGSSAGGISGTALGLLATLGLLGLGALTESRGSLRSLWVDKEPRKGLWR